MERLGKESEKRETKTSRKKKAKAEWKWAKVVFGKLEENEKRIDKLEKAVKLIREKLDI